MGKYDLPDDDEIVPEELLPDPQEHWEFVDGVGRNIISNTAVDLLNNGLSYFKWCKENPIITKRMITSGAKAGTMGRVEHTRPYTIKGLCLHCNIDEEYVADIRASKDKSNDYYVAMSKLLYIIYTQNLEGAMLDIYNAMFTAKVLNMEREEAPSGAIVIEHVGNLPPLLENENQILEMLDTEKPDWLKEQIKK